MADACSSGCIWTRCGEVNAEQAWKQTQFDVDECSKDVADDESELRDRSKQFAEQTGRSGPANRCRLTGQWSIEPDVGRVAHGVPNRVDRLKCLGNAVVPQQFYPIFKAIADIEQGEK
jgi:DNA (cytosine-5)-methyltransferase 1